MQPLEHVGTTLRRERRAREDTQGHVATLLGVGQSTLCRYEQGTSTPNEETMRRIAKYLGVPVRDLRQQMVGWRLHRWREELRTAIEAAEQEIARFREAS